jgi:hypothetical protein
MKAVVQTSHTSEVVFPTATEGIDEGFLAVVDTHEEMARQTDAMKLETQTGPDGDEDDRESDGDTPPGFNDDIE